MKRQHHREEHHASDLDLAFYSERLLAFGLDMALAVTGFFLTLKLAFPDRAVMTNHAGYPWAFAWIGVFLLYQAYYNSEGRVSLGKSVVGIRVVDLDGRPLDFSQSLLRSGAYILSSFLYLGFLWPLFNHRLQGFHDLIAGTVVVQDDSKPGRAWVLGGAWASAAVLVGHWVWVFVLSTPYYRLQTVANAYAGLHEVAQLNERYRAAKGHYTDNIYKLARFSGTPDEFLRSLDLIFDSSTGLKIQLKDEGFRLLAAARDEKVTVVKLDIN